MPPMHRHASFVVIAAGFVGTAAAMAFIIQRNEHTPLKAALLLLSVAFLGTAGMSYAVMLVEDRLRH